MGHIFMMHDGQTQSQYFLRQISIKCHFDFPKSRMVHETFSIIKTLNTIQWINILYCTLSISYNMINDDTLAVSVFTVQLFISSILFQRYGTWNHSNQIPPEHPSVIFQRGKTHPRCWFRAKKHLIASLGNTLNHILLKHCRYQWSVSADFNVFYLSLDTDRPTDRPTVRPTDRQTEINW